MQSLPIDPVLPAIVAALKSGRDVVLVAPPGSGKTTRVPPALIDAGFSSVLVLEPRRVAARLAAKRVAEERGFEVGQQIGYHVRFDRVAGPQTRVLFLTEGLLTRRLLDDVELAGVDVVIFDEFHERSLHADLGLGLVREVKATIRPDLRVVLMSATIDAEGLAAELGAEVVRSEGRAHPVAIEHLERSDDSYPAQLAEKAVRRVIDGAGGRLPCDTLLFLPGVGEIVRVENGLREVAKECGFDVLPLHGELPIEAQERAVRRGPRPRLVLATNVAETSLTLDGIALVIDSGLARVLRADPRSGVERLVLERISQANATQRAGRAGRQGPGRCLRLWTRVEDSALSPALEPEVLRVDLAQALLALYAFGVSDADSFAWITKPPVPSLSAAKQLLERIGALSRKSAGERPTLTARGKRMAQIPTAPRLAAMMLEGERLGCGTDAALLAAIVANPGLRRGAVAGRAETGPSDLIHLREAFFEVQAAGFDRGIASSVGIDARVARTVDREARQLERSVAKSRHEPAESDLLRCVLAGFPDRVAKRRAKGSAEAITATGNVVTIDEDSCVRDAELFVAVDAIELGGRKVKAATLSAIEEEWLAELHPSGLREEVETTFDEAKGRVEARGRRYFLALPLRDLGARSPDPEEAARLLAKAALHPRALEALRANGLDAVLARIDCVRASHPQLGWPEIGDAELESALGESLVGRTRLEGEGGLDVEEIGRALARRLGAGAEAALERLAPRRITLPSGRAAEIEYRKGQSPIVRGKLQEFFGAKESPRIAEGRVVVAVDLTLPNQRSIQITTDLKSFFLNLYPKERRELMRRYPRHSWPEDPMAAPPTSRPLPRRR